MLPANTSHLPIGLHEQIAGITDFARRKDEFANFKLFNELLFQESRALLLVKSNENPFSFADLPEQYRIVG